MDDKDFPEIYTGNGIDRDLAATANDRIKKAVIEMRGLKQTIVDLDRENGKLQRKIYWLSIVGAVLAATQIIQVVKILKDW